jgi:phage shock protein PspC (stress-responsive transcriptional regulator)
MGSESAAGETAGIFDKIAVSLGMSPFFVEISFIILAMIVILIVIIFLFAILRMRKEMISLNFKLGYIARLLKREIEGPPPGPQAEEKKEADKEDAFKEEWKF